jgi:hypothetical protein
LFMVLTESTDLSEKVNSKSFPMNSNK